MAKSQTKKVSEIRARFPTVKGTIRFTDKKRKSKKDKTGRKQKYRPTLEKD